MLDYLVLYQSESGNTKKIIDIDQIFENCCIYLLAPSRQFQRSDRYRYR